MKNVGAVNDKEGEKIQQDIQAMEGRYQGFGNEAMMGNYCWILFRDDQATPYEEVLFKTHLEVI